MALLPQQFTRQDLPETQRGFLVPEGQYKAVWLESEIKPTAKGGQQLVYKGVIIEGPQTNIEFFERLNIINTGEKKEITERIAYETLLSMAEAIGSAQTPKNTEDLHNKPFFIDVVTEKGTGTYVDKNGEEKPRGDQSRVKKYLPLPTVGAPGIGYAAAQQPAAAQSAPTISKPAWAR